MPLQTACQRKKTGLLGDFEEQTFIIATNRRFTVFHFWAYAEGSRAGLKIKILGLFCFKY